MKSTMLEMLLFKEIASILFRSDIFEFVIILNLVDLNILISKLYKSRARCILKLLKKLFRFKISKKKLVRLKINDRLHVLSQ